MLKAGSLIWYSCWREWFKSLWPALELLEKEARNLNNCFLPDFGVTLALWPFAEQGCSCGCGWLHSSLIHIQTADFMSRLGSCLPHHPWDLSDGLDSWLNLVTVTRPAWLVCCCALPLTGEAAASACFSDAGFTVTELLTSAAPQCLPAQLCQMWGLYPPAQKHNFHIELQDPRCFSEAGYSRDEICTFTALDYSFTQFQGSYSLFWIRSCLACWHTIPLCKQVLLSSTFHSCSLSRLS